MTRRLEGMGQVKYTGLTTAKHFNGVLKTHDDAIALPLRWKKPRRVFVNSMSDLFHKDVPFEFVDKVFAVMALCPQHTFQVLTKRPERMAEYFSSRTGVMNLHWLLGPGISTHDEVEEWCRSNGITRKERQRRVSNAMYSYRGYCSVPPWPLPQVHLGTSVENQQTADERIPHLLRCPAAVRFLSCEPLLEAVDLSVVLKGRACGVCEGTIAAGGQCTCWSKIGRLLQWLIVGGESGPGPRPCDLTWIRSIVQQCRAAGVPVFVKQLGAHPFDSNPAESFGFHGSATPVRLSLKHKKGGDISEWPEDLRIREFPN